MKRYLSFLLFLSCILYSAFSGAAETHERFGVVDLQRALNVSEKGKEAKSKLEKERDEKQTVITEKENELKKLRDEIDKQSQILSEEVRRKKEETYSKLLRDYQRFVSDAKQEIEKKERELTQRIIKELIEVVKEFGEKNHFTMIFETGTVVYSDKTLDVTGEIIKLFNSK